MVENDFGKAGVRSWTQKTDDRMKWRAVLWDARPIVLLMNDDKLKITVAYDFETDDITLLCWDTD